MKDMFYESLFMKRIFHRDDPRQQPGADDVKTVKDIITGLRGTLSPKSLALAKHIESNYDEVAFQSSALLAKKSGCSEATVTRFAYACGFIGGFTEMQEAMRRELRSRVSLPKYVPQRGSRSILSEIAAMEKSIIDEMLASIPEADFSEAVDKIFAGDRFLVVGAHPDSVPAMYAAYFFSAFRPNVHLVTEAGVRSFNAAGRPVPGTVVLAYSFPRYARATLDILAALKDEHTHIIGVTDLSLAPIAEYADTLLLVPTKYASYIDPQAAIMVLNHALMTGVIMRDRDQYHQSIKLYDKYMTANDVFVNSELDIAELTPPEDDDA